MDITKNKISNLSLSSRNLMADQPIFPKSIINISKRRANVLALTFGIGAIFFANLVQEVQANDSISNTSQTTNTTNNTNNEDSLLMSIWNIFKPKPSQPLTNFRYSYGGNMNGNSHSEVVTVINGETILSISHADWYYEPQKVTEYIVDSSTLKEIDDICKKYKMKSWENKKFSDIFVSDGESYSYSFSFGDDESFYFSSQIYSSPYREKLKEIHNAIDKGLKIGKTIPGFVSPKLSKEEIFERRNNPKNEVSFEVTSYRLGKITYNINNNTSNEITIPKDYTTKLLLGDTVIHEEKASRSRDYTISQNSNIEKTIKLDKFLEPGIYKLEVDSYNTEFEIK